MPLRLVPLEARVCGRCPVSAAGRWARRCWISPSARCECRSRSPRTRRGARRLGGLGQRRNRSKRQSSRHTVASGRGRRLHSLARRAPPVLGRPARAWRGRPRRMRARGSLASQAPCRSAATREPRWRRRAPCRVQAPQAPGLRGAAARWRRAVHARRPRLCGPRRRAPALLQPQRRLCGLCPAPLERLRNRSRPNPRLCLSRRPSALIPLSAEWPPPTALLRLWVPSRWRLERCRVRTACRALRRLRAAWRLRRPSSTGRPRA
jgi:hypothetical protein